MAYYYYYYHYCHAIVSIASRLLMADPPPSCVAVKQPCDRPLKCRKSRRITWTRSRCSCWRKCASSSTRTTARSERTPRKTATSTPTSTKVPTSPLFRCRQPWFFFFFFCRVLKPWLPIVATRPAAQSLQRLHLQQRGEAAAPAEVGRQDHLSR